MPRDSLIPAKALASVISSCNEFHCVTVKLIVFDMAPVLNTGNKLATDGIHLHPKDLSGTLCGSSQQANAYS